MVTCCGNTLPVATFQVKLGSEGEIGLGVMMRRFYKVLFREDSAYGVAYAIDNCAIIDLPYSGRVKKWKPLLLELREGEPVDYLANSLGCRLCSNRLRQILEANASEEDELQWLPVIVKHKFDTHQYSILHFPNPPCVINESASILVDDFVVKPVLLRSAITVHAVFSYPNAGELPLFISDIVKDAIEAVGCSGIEFKLAAVS